MSKKLDYADHGCAICDAADVETYHWFSATSTVGVAWSCSDECGAALEALRNAAGQLHSAAITRFRRKRRTIVERIVSGELVDGTWVEIEGEIVERGRTRQTRQAGYFVATRPTDWDHSGELYHYFRDGHINGVAQTVFGIPASQLQVTA